MRAYARSRKLERLLGWGIWLGFFFTLFLPSKVEGRETSPSLDILAQQIGTPQALEKFMRKNFLYVEDRILFGRDEYWQTPEEMLHRKKGDCEDFAVFAEAILKRNGYHVFLFSVFWQEDAHTVTVFEKDGKWGIFDLDNLRSLKGNSIKDLGNEIKHSWSFLGIMRQEGNSGVISRKFQNQKAAELNLSLLFR